MIALNLSQEFYERFGNAATNELVAVLNTISLGYRNELREINELNYARFDAKVGERLAELRAELKQEIAAVRIEVTGVRADVDALRRVLKWMFAFWVPSFLVLVGLILTRT
jgi:hypothetical protein